MKILKLLNKRGSGHHGYVWNEYLRHCASCVDNRGKQINLSSIILTVGHSHSEAQGVIIHL